MTLAERQPLTRLPENPVVNEAGELQKGFSRKDAQKYLDLDSQRLRAHWQDFIGPSIEVPACPEFIQKFERFQRIEIVDGKITFIRGRMPLYVPKIPVEQLALALGEDIKKYTQGYLLGKEEDREWEWMLTDASFFPSHLGATESQIENFLGIRNDPGVRKLNNENDPIPVGLMPVGFGMGAYIVCRKYIKWITDEFPDKGIWSRLAMAKVGGTLNPAIRAVDEKGETLETKTGWKDYSASDVGWPVGLIEG